MYNTNEHNTTHSPPPTKPFRYVIDIGARNISDYKYLLTHLKKRFYVVFELMHSKTYALNHFICNSRFIVDNISISNKNSEETVYLFNDVDFVSTCPVNLLGLSRYNNNVVKDKELRIINTYKLKSKKLKSWMNWNIPEIEYIYKLNINVLGNHERILKGIGRDLLTRIKNIYINIYSSTHGFVNNANIYEDQLDEFEYTLYLEKYGFILTSKHNINEYIVRLHFINTHL